jgi:hypothetical protein
VRPVEKGSITHPKLKLPLAVPPIRRRLSKVSTPSRHVARAAVGGTTSCSRLVEYRCAKSRELPCASRRHALSNSFASRYARSRPPQIPSCHSHFTNSLLCRRPASSCNGGSAGRDLLYSMWLCSLTQINERLPPTSAPSIYSSCRQEPGGNLLSTSLPPHRSPPRDGLGQSRCRNRRTPSVCQRGMTPVPAPAFLSSNEMAAASCGEIAGTWREPGGDPAGTRICPRDAQRAVSKRTIKQWKRG